MVKRLDFSFFIERNNPADFGSDEHAEFLAFVFSHQEKTVVSVAFGPDFRHFDAGEEACYADFSHKNVADKL